jgi:hypothetical protein
MMIDQNLARLRAHRNNVHRYRRLLATQLSDLERAYIERRLSEERASIEALSQATFPFSVVCDRATKSLNDSPSVKAVLPSIRIASRRGEATGASASGRPRIGG